MSFDDYLTKRLLNFFSKNVCFELLDEYGQRKEKIPLTGDVKQWTWFKSYLFSKKKIDLIEQLRFLNVLVICNALFGYEEFSTCIDNSILPQKPIVCVCFYFKKKRIRKKDG